MCDADAPGVTTGEMYLQQTDLPNAVAQLEELNTRCAGSRFLSLQRGWRAMPASWSRMSLIPRYCLSN